jgi:hypothetical protein
MRIKEMGLTALGVLSLVWPWVTVKPFVNDDYDAELKMNKQLALRPKSEIDQKKQEYEPEVKERMTTFRRGFWGSFWFLVTAVFVALVLAAFWRSSSEAKLLLGGASIFVFAWSTLARLGRSATSIGGKTALERVDMRMLWILYWVGTLLGTLALV